MILKLKASSDLTSPTQDFQSLSKQDFFYSRERETR